MWPPPHSVRVSAWRIKLWISRCLRLKRLDICIYVLAY